MNAVATKLDSVSHDLVQTYGKHGVLSALIRADGTSDCVIVCPAGYEAELAKMLYRAADTMAEHAPNPHKASP